MADHARPLAFDQAFKPKSLASIERHGQSQPPRLHLHPQYEDVVTESTPDGPDYLRFCERHQWASHPLPDVELLSACPFCAVECDEARGRRRYVALQARLGEGRE